MSRGSGAVSARSGFALGFSAGAIVASAVFLMSDARDEPRDVRPVAAVSAASTGTSQMSSGSGAGSMEAATLALETRLATQGGSDEQWELLAKSYEFMGRDKEAGLARRHRTAPDRSLRDAVSASARLLTVVGGATPAVPADPAPTKAASLLASAEQHRRNREFKQACDAYASVVDLGAMNADSWADYADAQASLAGRLAGAPERAIDAALAADPRHPKALWLKASVQHEQQRYADALVTWQRLLKVVPPGTSDARIVEANIAEATRLAAG